MFVSCKLVQPRNIAQKTVILKYPKRNCNHLIRLQISGESTTTLPSIQDELNHYRNCVISFARVFFGTAWLLKNLPPGHLRFEAMRFLTFLAFLSSCYDNILADDDLVSAAWERNGSDLPSPELLGRKHAAVVAVGKKPKWLNSISPVERDFVWKKNIETWFWNVL